MPETTARKREVSITRKSVKTGYVYSKCESNMFTDVSKFAKDKLTVNDIWRRINVNRQLYAGDSEHAIPFVHNMSVYNVLTANNTYTARW